MLPMTPLCSIDQVDELPLKCSARLDEKFPSSSSTLSTATVTVDRVGLLTHTSSLSSVTSSALDSVLSLKRERRVTFRNEAEVREVPHLSEVSADEQVATWWTPNDYMLIRRMMKITLQMMMRGEVWGSDEPEFCARGLEFRTRTGSQKHYRNRKHATKAVLLAQDFQRYEGFNDPDYISELYAEHSRRCCLEARILGLTDEQDALL